MAARPTRATSLLFAVLLAASFITAAVVIRAKTPDLMLEVTKLPGALPDPATGQRQRHAFTPDGDGRHDGARIVLFVRESEQHATVEIIDADDDVVRTLAADVPLRADQRVHFRWNGRTDRGRPAPRGSYRVRVDLPDLDREAVDPRRIVLLRR